MEIQTAEQEQTTHLGMVYTLYHLFIAGWWFRTFFSHILGIIQLTFLFFRGVETINQMVIWGDGDYDCFTDIIAYHGIKSKSKPVQTGLDTLWIFGDLSMLHSLNMGNKDALWDPLSQLPRYLFLELDQVIFFRM
jgi:hypothetical protein